METFQENQYFPRHITVFVQNGMGIKKEEKTKWQISGQPYLPILLI